MSKLKQPVKEDTVTFTTTKREDGFMFLHSQFNYVDGRRTTLKKDGVYIELNRGVEFKPRDFCRAFKGFGWKDGELEAHAEDLIEALEAKAANRSTKICRYEDRPRPDAQIRLEGELRDARDTIAEWEALFQAAAEQNPEILKLKEKVLAKG